MTPFDSTIHTVFAASALGKQARKFTVRPHPLRGLLVLMAILLTALDSQARTVGLDGVGIDIRQVDQIFRYKSDYLDTSSFSGGLIFPRSSPARVKDKEYACRGWMPIEQDSRTNNEIKQIRANAAGDLLIAMPSVAATGDGWVRLTTGTTPDFYLDHATRSAQLPRIRTPAQDQGGSSFQCRKEQRLPSGNWLRKRYCDTSARSQGFDQSDLGSRLRRPAAARYEQWKVHRAV